MEFLTNFVSQVTAHLGAVDYAAISSAIVTIVAVLEKLFDVDFVGRKIFRMIWSGVSFFMRRLFGPEFEKLKTFIHLGEKINELVAKSDARDATLQTIKNEVTMNGGSSMKDAVMRLLRHDDEKYALIDEIRGSVQVVNLRLDIVDEDDQRMQFRLSPSGECLMIDPAFLRFFGYVKEDLLGAYWERCVASRSLEVVRTKWQQALEKHLKYHNEQYLVDSDGREHLCRVRGYPMTEDGTFTGFFGTVEVIGE